MRRLYTAPTERGPNGRFLGGKTHGMCNTPEYRAWAQMIERCENPENAQWCDYGGRGIRVCDRWRAGFLAFLEDVGRKPSPGHSIDRIDNDKGYEPGNVAWRTRREQNRNTRYNRRLELDGKVQCLTDWAAEYGLPLQTVIGRLHRGMALRDALTAPKQLRGRHARQRCA